MSVQLQDLITFHLTGKRDNAQTKRMSGADMVPALLAPYRELSQLRYDYPLILVDGPDTRAFVDTLSGVINRLLRDIAPQGNGGEQLRQHILRLEGRMRELAADSAEGTLAALWKQAEQSLLAECSKAEAEWLGNSIATARFALRIDGQVVDCDERLPARLIEHAWAKLAARRPESARRISDLIIRLRNILKVDDLKSGTSRTPQKLKSTLGKRYKEAFDFERMAELLEDSTPHNRLPPERRERIRSALGTLESQKFFATTAGKPQGESLHDFVFDNLAAALKAYHSRVSEMTDIVRAIGVAELELDNAYCEDKHGAFFTRFGPQALTAEDLALFPSYLVCLHESDCNTRDLARLMEIVSRDLPMKVLIHVSDPLGDPSADNYPHRGSFVQQLVQTFVAGNAYVMQSPASHLYRQRESIQRGLEFAGPAIFSVFVPFMDDCPLLPAYLVSAAGMESRVFPAFSYDPTAGSGLADRFDILCNPEVDKDWPRRQLHFEDEKLQAVTEDLAFTAVDFALIEPKYGDHFALAAKDAWEKDLVPVADYIDRTNNNAVESVPAVAVVDSGNVLQRLVVDEQLIRMARRCRERWHALQELGGVHNSYASAARQALTSARAEAQPQPVDAVARPSPGETTTTQTVDEVAQPSREGMTPPEPVADIDAGDQNDAYIETPRCTTCDECTNRNDRMFAYDDNKQAFIKDPDAGTYRELVEAAENCQVAIIHPGLPRNPDEPGLDELIERAKPFNS
jgi:hypothetical protein